MSNDHDKSCAQSGQGSHYQRTGTAATTSDGLEYYNRAVRLIADLNSVDSAARGKRLKPGGHLRIDAPISFANRLLIPALAKFHQEYPDITIAVGINDRTVNVVSEAVDRAIPAGELQDITMVGRKIADFAYVTCASPTYLACAGMASSPTDLA
jgi:DNA-binding transcriptional LysR family regulator